MEVGRYVVWLPALQPCGLMPVRLLTDCWRFATNPCATAYGLQPTIHMTARDASLTALAKDTGDDAPMIRRRRQDELRRRRWARLAGQSTVR